MREPSIHITKSQFEEILNTLEVDRFPIEAFFVIAKKKAINHRAVLVSNNRNSKQINNILLANSGDASLVADIIYATRIQLKHRGVRKINQGNQRDWTLCKKLAAICNTFCEDFSLETREGFIKYIEIGLNRMKDNRNMLQRLISMADNITAQLEAEAELQYSDSSFTLKVHDYFVKKIARSTGIVESYENNPEKYVHFARMASFLTEHKWDYEDFIDAQFDSLAWCNGLPDIAQLYTDKAIERFNKYMYKNKGKQSLVDEPEVEGSLWDKIK